MGGVAGYGGYAAAPAGGGGGVTDLQTAYDGGNTIVVDNANAIIFANTDVADNTSVLLISNSGTGNAFLVSDSGGTVFSINGAGAIQVSPTAGQNLTLTCTGGGVVAENITATGSSGTFAAHTLTVTVSQSGTAGYTGLVVNTAAGTGTGSGAALLASFNAASVAKCTIDTNGCLFVTTDGTTTVPALAIGDADTGLLRNVAVGGTPAGGIEFVQDGGLAAIITRFNNVGRVLGDDGAADRPSFGFYVQPSTGWWRQASGTISMSSVGTESWRIGATSISARGSATTIEQGTAATGLTVRGNITTTVGPSLTLTNANIFTGSANVQINASVSCSVDQSGTAGYTGLVVNVTENATGSGAKKLISGQISSVERHYVDREGSVGIKTQAAFANSFTQFGPSNAISTANATPTALITFAITDTVTYLIEAYVVGRQSGGTNRASYARRITIYREGGGATVQGAVQTVGTDEESDASWDCTMDVSGNNVRVMVTGVAATTIYWSGHLRIQPISTNA